MEEKTLVPVPADDASWYDIGVFALSYNGYDRYLGEIGPFANETSRTWWKTQVLPNDLASLRAVLFYEQRRWHHFGDAPDETTAMPYIKALLTAIRTLTVSTLPGPSDLPN
jgi:hypothetical protein